MEYISLIGAIIACIFLTYSIYKGLNLPIAAILTTALICLTSGMNLDTIWNEAMDSAVLGMVSSCAGIYIFGGILGYFYSESGAATSLALMLFRPFKNIRNRNLKLSCEMFMYIVLAGLLGLAGVDRMASMVMMIGVAITFFKDCNVPRKYINCLLTIGGTAVGLLPYIPSVYNIIIPLWVPGFTKGSYAGLRILWTLVFIAGSIILMLMMINKDNKNGVGFDYGNMKDESGLDAEGAKRPNGVVSLIPIVVILIFYNFVNLSAWLSTAIGCIAALILFFRFLPLEGTGKAKLGSLVRKININYNLIPLYMCLSALPGAAICASPCYDLIIRACTSMANVLPLPLAFGLVAIILILMGNSALFLIANIGVTIFAPLGLSAGAIGLLTMMGNTVFDSLPNAPGIVMQAEVTDTPLSVGYPSIFKTTVVYTGVLVIAFSLLMAVGIGF